MGYYASLQDGELHVPAEKLEEARAAVSSYADDDKQELKEILDWHGFEVESDDQGLFAENFDGKWRNQDGLIRALAPFAEPTFLHFVGEDGAHWGFKLEDGKCVELNGKVTFE